VGNISDVNTDKPVQNLMGLARRHGPIFQLDLPGRTLVVVSGFDLVDELCDEKRFDKLVWTPLRNVRAFTGDGLFTSWTREPNWRKAHNILLPTFSSQAMKGYHHMMADIAAQLADKWARLNPDDEIDVSADMTRLALDTIGLCGFDYRFNSFYRDEPHPFIVSMVRALGESLQQMHRLPGQDRLMPRTRRQFQGDIAAMNHLVDTLIAERKASGVDLAAKKDLLGYMLAGVDRGTGERLDDVNIRHQIITFLIAGHETTSGLLSFALYFLLKNPTALQRAYEEVDRVLAGDPTALPTHEQVHRLTYVAHILDETLRLWPTAPAFALYPYEPTVIGGTYAVDPSHHLVALIPMLHRDPAVWGPDAEAFNPDRFDREARRDRPANAYKPFGNGQRACIGRQFARQEATLVLGMLLRRFELVDYTNYHLKIKETLTLKPDNFYIKVRPRAGRALAVPAPRPAREEMRPAPVGPEPRPAPTGPKTRHNTPLLVLYGSNLGTAEGIAEDIAADGKARGLPTTVAPLDDYAGKLPARGAVVVVTSSYNGTPPDNAVRFRDWLCDAALPADALRGVSYTIFGCGSRDWAATYQAVPTLIDEQLEAHGARRVYERGEGDACDDADGQFRAWHGPLWGMLAEALSIPVGEPEITVARHRYEVEVVGAEGAAPAADGYGARPLAVRANRELHQTGGLSPSERSARHVELILAEGMGYNTGDHLGVLPRNGEALVRRAMARFAFADDARVRVRDNTGGRTGLPVDRAIAVRELLSDYVELQDTAARAPIAAMVEYTDCPPEKAWLRALVDDDARYRDEIMATHTSLLDLLERFESCALPFYRYLEFVPPLRPRYYSISSSPLVDPYSCSLTVAVIDAPARGGHGRYNGVCSSYLARQPEGSVVYGFVHRPGTPFHPPADARTPMIMVGAGTGLAPFRGFLQERALLEARGREVGPALLFFGCRHPRQDFIYQDELEAFAARGIVSLSCAFSRLDGQKAYVQHELAARRDEVWPLLEEGAVVYVCGDAARMAPDVTRAFIEIYPGKTGAGEPEARSWLDEMAAAGRYVVDVWPSS